MTLPDDQGSVPFWQRKTLSEMTDSEWESVCDGCGRCCLEKLGVHDSSDVYPLDVGCTLLDPITARCTDYPNRLSRDVGCFKVTPDRLPTMPWLPPTCGYQRIHLGKPLDWWHPLVSGNPDAVRQAGISAGGRFVTRRHAGPMEYHTVDWPSREVTRQPQDKWLTAMFGGVNAAVPTPFAADSRVDLDLMAKHCFWLLANGCHGLAILDKTGEVASLTIDERLTVLDGLVSRGVPPSKILAGIGPASVEDSVRIAVRATELGIRGAMVTASVRARTDRIMPHEIMPDGLRALIQRSDLPLHLYLSLAVSPAATAAGLTALETLMMQAPGRLRGIRDETTGGTFAIAVLERFQGGLFEVYTADDTVLGALVQQGGAGLISARANLLSRLCAQVMNAGEPDQVAGARNAVEAARRSLSPHAAVPAIKAMLSRHTGNPVWDRVRLPLRPARASERAALFKAFDATGIKLQAAR